MIWFTFVVSTVILVIAAVKLAQYGDVIAVRTGLGGMFVGTLLLAGATSLPELLTAVSAINQGEPALTAGNFFGSSMFNMFLIGVLDLIYRKGSIFKRVAVNHALTAGHAVLLTGLAVFFIEAKLGWRVGWLGLDSLLILGFYISGVYLIQQSNQSGLPAPTPAEEDLSGLPALWRAGLGFTVAAGVLVIATPLLVRSSIGIAEATGLSTGFIGMALLAVVTSLPEVVTTISAARLGAYDLAVGNLFGSNVFNIFALGLADLFYTRGALLTDLDPTLAMAGMLALLMTALALIGNLARVERRVWFIEVDAILLVVFYFGGMVFLYNRGIGM
jgi:cation:H+ antiporter